MALHHVWTIPKRKVYYSITAVLLIIFIAVLGFEFIVDSDLWAADNQAASPPTGKVSIVIKLDQRRLELYNNGQVYKRYRVAVGKKDSPSPVGEWNIVHKDYSDKALFGTRWMGLNVPWGSYGIHGTNMPWSIGSSASKGCIRMGKKDIEELYEWAPLGTPVTIEGRRDKVTRVLKYQTIGQDVVMLQLRLKELGFFMSRADGIFGQDTLDAVKVYQEEAGVEITGIVDMEMIKRLDL